MKKLKHVTNEHGVNLLNGTSNVMNCYGNEIVKAVFSGGKSFLIENSEVNLIDDDNWSSFLVGHRDLKQFGATSDQLLCRRSAWNAGWDRFHEFSAKLSLDSSTETEILSNDVAIFEDEQENEKFGSKTRLKSKQSIRPRFEGVNECLAETILHNLAAEPNLKEVPSAFGQIRNHENSIWGGWSRSFRISEYDASCCHICKSDFAKLNGAKSKRS